MVKKCGLLEEQAGQHHPLPQTGAYAILCARTSLYRPFFRRAGRQLTVDNGYEKGEQDGCHPDELFHIFFKLGLTLVIWLLGKLSGRDSWYRRPDRFYRCDFNSVEDVSYYWETGSVCFDGVKLVWVCASLLVYPVGAVRFM